jgi:hypothetical protein
LLSFRSLPAIHSGRNLAEHVHGILHEFNAHLKLFCITTDSASNNIRMMKELSILLQDDGVTWDGLAHHIRCLSHVINLAVKAFLSNLKISQVSDEEDWDSHDDVLESTFEDQSDNDDEDLYGNMDDDSDGNHGHLTSIDTNETLSFENVLRKVRSISKGATATPKRIHSFESCCQATNIKPLRPIRDHAIRWNATFQMLQRAIFLRRAIDLWTKSNSQFANLQLSPLEWDMIEFLVQFLYPFMVASTMIQATAQPSLSDTWVVYEELFDTLEDSRTALSAIQVLPEWLKETQTAIEGMWTKLRTYYDKTDKPYAYVDATLLHPALKKKFMKKSGYDNETIERYVKEAETRYQKSYDPPDPTQQPPRTHVPTQRGKRRRPVDTSGSDSSDGMECNEFSSYMTIRRDGTATDPLKWWKGSQTLYPKLSKMARDVLAVPATGAGVEREFSISGRVVTKQRNQLKASTIRDIMQYKRWVAKHGAQIRNEEPLANEVEGEEMDYDAEDEFTREEEEEEMENGVAEWLKEWLKRESISGKVRKLTK